MLTPGSARRRRRRWLLLAAVLVLVFAGGAVAIIYASRPQDVHNSNAPFNPKATTVPHKVRPKAFAWPTYGYDNARRRTFLSAPQIKPPFRQVWRQGGRALLEFPPVIHGNRLFQLDDDGVLHARDTRTGEAIWTRKLGDLAAVTPAIGQGKVYATLLSAYHGGKKGKAGRVVALRERDGHIVWDHRLGDRSESSPLYAGGTIYFGDESGVFHAMNARTGRTLWRFRAKGAIKDAPALSDGILYFGDYAGRVYALRQKNGAVVWSKTTSGARLGFGSGEFYSSPAIAYGRVFLGNTDGFMYSFVARTGELAWRVKTGNYVYASPAVADVAGLGPTVFAGSYDSKFYAWDAKTGEVRWKYDSGGKISGSATVVNDVVYFADLGTRTTEGLNARTGKRVFHWREGSFNSVVADPERLYVTGYGNLFALEPSKPSARSGAKAKGKRAAQRKTRRHRRAQR